MPSMISRAAFIIDCVSPNIVTTPSSFTSTDAPVSACIPLITAPPLPIISFILSWCTVIFFIAGVLSDNSFGAEITAFIFSKICILAFFAFSNADSIISAVIP